MTNETDAKIKQIKEQLIQELKEELKIVETTRPQKKTHAENMQSIVNPQQDNKKHEAIMDYISNGPKPDENHKKIMAQITNTKTKHRRIMDLIGRL